MYQAGHIRPAGRVFETPGLKELSASEKLVVKEKNAKTMKVKSRLDFRVCT
jgi:hypothetical protein